MATELTNDVMRYQETGEGWEPLFDKIRIFVYRYPHMWSGWDEDRCSDFFLSYHSRIPGLVNRFQPDYSFETYLSSSLRWYMKTYTEKLASREHYESWSSDPLRAEDDGFGEPGGYSPAADADWDDDPMERTEGPFAVDDTGRLKDPHVRKRILYIALLRAADLEEERIVAVARLADVDPDWLFERSEKARKLVADKVERRETLRHRRNECWYRMDIATRRKRSEETRDSSRYREWQRKARTWKARYESASTNLKAVKVAPSHKDIGRLLDTPTGTISSGIHLIKKAWERTGGDRVPLRMEA